MRGKNLKYFVLGFALAAVGLWAVAVGNLTTFQAGTPIKAGEVNQNFAVLKDGIAALESNKLSLPFNATTSSTNAAFSVVNSGAGPAIQGSSPNAGGDGLSGISLQGAAVKAYSESGYGLDARSGSGSTIRVQSSSQTCAVCIFQGDGGDIISGAGPTVRNGYNFRVTSSADVFARAFNVASDRNLKTNIKRVDVTKVLEQVTRLPISHWNYKDDAPSVAHIGPMAQDFQAAFGLNGSDDKRISAVDAQGVALAAVQGLNQKLEHQVTKLEAENAKLRAGLSALEARLSKLEGK